MTEIMGKLEKQGFVKRFSNNPNTPAPNAITKFIFLDHKSIIERYNSIIRGYLNYYSPADNFYKFGSIVGYILRHSAAKTLARKYNLRTRAGAFKKFGKDLEITIEKNNASKTYSLSIPHSFKNTRDFKVTGGFLKDPLMALNYQIYSQSSLDETCAVCGSVERVEMHHVKHIRKMSEKVTGFTKLMAKLNRKQIPVCAPCHKEIHIGNYNGLNLNEL